MGRSINWALVRRDSADTVILFHHHDTVDTEDFGSLKDLAFDNQALKEKLKEESIHQDVLADIVSGDWQFGRGSCDMKAALALQLGVLEEYSSVSTGQANLLYLSVGDEEAYSQGMRAAVGLLYDLKERFDLNYILAIDSEPFESTSESEKVLRAAGYFSLLYLDKSPQDLLELIRGLMQEALDEFYDKYTKLQDQYQESKSMAKPRVLTYQDLLEECQKKAGFKDFMERVNQEAKVELQKGLSYQEVTLSNVQKALDFYDKKEALAVLAVAPPYYPTMNSRRLQEQDLDMDRFISFYQNYLANKGSYQLKVEEFFMGICDMSYCALEKPLSDYQSLLNSMAVSKEVYPLDLEKIAGINVAAVNLGPWGKDLHQLTERVYEKDMLDTIPAFFLYLLEHLDEVKRN